MSSSEPAKKLFERFPGLLAGPVEFRGELTLLVLDSERIAEVCAAAKAELNFDCLADLASVDHFGEEPRFSLVYQLYGMGHHCYLRLKTSVSEEKLELPTVSAIWPTANWHEREIYDMMGLRFRGHPDLRRILMWEGYPYFPLRKDFPLAGKSSEVPELAFTEPVPLQGGPFVTVPGGKDAIAREPRVRDPQADALEANARLERRRDLGRADDQRGNVNPTP